MLPGRAVEIVARSPEAGADEDESSGFRRAGRSTRWPSASSEPRHQVWLADNVAGVASVVPRSGAHVRRPGMRTSSKNSIVRLSGDLRRSVAVGAARSAHAPGYPHQGLGDPFAEGSHYSRSAGPCGRRS